MTRIDDCILVMLQGVAFSGLMQRHQHLANELSNYLPVIYIEETQSRLKFLFQGKVADPAINGHKKGLQPVKDNLWLYKSPPESPRYYGYRKSSIATYTRITKSIKPFLSKDKKVIIWLFSPHGIGAMGRFGEILTIFDCFDAFGEFPGEERYKIEVKAAVREIAEKADIVFAASDELGENLKIFNDHTYILKNGCDAKHFLSGGTRPSASDERVKLFDSIKHPIIGYMGDIAPWVNLELLKNCAERHPEWSIVLIGTWKRDKADLEKYPNVYSLGKIPYEELPYYVGKFDIGTIPFELTNLTRVVNPLKLYEYFAFGLPVVSVPIPEVSIYEDLVYLAGSPDEFVALAEKGLKESPESEVKTKRVKIARENSWHTRGETVRDLLEKCLREILP
ncbi:MAG: glycosyltransferase [bacterium]